MGNRAKVIFTDGFHVSPTVETTNENLKARIEKTLDAGEASPSTAAARFTISTAVAKLPVSIHNTPEGRTFGGTLATIMGEGFWPGVERGCQAGVFFVWLEEKKIEYWGGSGFSDSPEFTKAIAQVEML